MVHKNPPAMSVLVVVVIVADPSLVTGAPIRVVVVETGPSTAPPGDVMVHPSGTVKAIGSGVTRGIGV
jgi:hypothetical protein